MIPVSVKFFSLSLAVLAAGALLAGVPGRNAPDTGVKAGPFDFYLLALTFHPAFCAERRQMQECRLQGGRPLVIHGLWPERRAPGAYPRDCAAAPLQLAPELSGRLAEWMPGVASGLQKHEWRKHGACSGLSDDDYFSESIRLARALDAALRPRLTTLAGGHTTARELRAAADAAQPGLGATFTLHCRTLRNSGNRGRPHLTELRQCVDNDGPGGAPRTLLDCASVGRRDQGCGDLFLIADRQIAAGKIAGKGATQ